MYNKSSYIVSAIYILLGLTLIVKPDIVGNTLCYLLALAVGAMGIIYILSYMMTTVESRVVENTNGLAGGIVMIILAIFIIAKKELVISLVPFLFGLLITVKGVLGIQHAINMKRFNVKNFKGSLFGAIAIMLFGLILMMFPFHTVKLFFVIIGAGLLVSGILDILANMRISHQLNKARNEQ
ncbi:HdeD family acid-resistance protein [Hornefia butyriciproducens]|uniref:HdeD family acid-resistance protein n=1 Tax=Hornefia butyriciproducens TaxID=2652293 RepID=UPI0023F1689E|nr:DUF308 domain-containing protein [Hornefia butyriciproducens]MCI7327764.1 DUF308 domain-containing protein [Clostridiales bacterium]MDD6298263.1 DUF308 domain-containing protein [Hornefia butyriciproducens]MDY2990462.1 DUF308 domain-containing protein [Hornefia butyriciproducens]